jgi:hypothetical protein
MEHEILMKKKREAHKKILDIKGKQIVRVQGEKIEKFNDTMLENVGLDLLKETFVKVEE